MADKDTKVSSVPMTRLGPSLAKFSMGSPSRDFYLRELPVGRVKKLGLKITEAFNRIAALQGNDPAKALGAEIGSFLESYGTAVFEEITGIWNWLFEYGAKGMDQTYEPITQEWLEDNVTVSMLSDLIKEVAEQSRMAWLIPFFKSQIATAVRNAVSTTKNGKAGAAVAS